MSELIELELEDDGDIFGFQETAKVDAPEKVEKVEEKPDESSEEKPEKVVLLGEDDEEEEEEEEEPVKKPKAAKVSKAADENEFAVYASALNKLGIIQDEFMPEDGDIDEDKLSDAVEKSYTALAKSKINEILSNFGDDYKQAFIDIYVKGADPKEYWKTFAEQQEIAEYDPTQQNDAEAIVRHYLKLRDETLTEEELAEEIANLKDTDKLETAAKKYQPKLDSYYTRKREAEAARKQEERELEEERREQRLSEIEEALESAIEKGDIDNIPFSKKEKDKLFDFITDDSQYTYAGKPVTPLFAKLMEVQSNPSKLLVLAKLLMNDMKLDNSTAVKIASKEAKKVWDKATSLKQSTKRTVSSDDDNWW